MNTNTVNAQTEADLKVLTEQALSKRARLVHLLVLLAGTAMTIVLFSLLATETALPARTQIAFGVMLLAALTWVGYSGWVLARRHTLLVNHRVVAASMSLAFSTLFTAGALLVGFADGVPPAFLAAGLGGLCMVVAAVLLIRARSERARLVARRDELMARW